MKDKKLEEEVNETLNVITELRKQLEQTETTNDALQIEINNLKGRINILTQELAESQGIIDKYQALKSKVIKEPTVEENPEIKMYYGLGAKTRPMLDDIRKVCGQRQVDVKDPAVRNIVYGTEHSISSFVATLRILSTKKLSNGKPGVELVLIPSGKSMRVSKFKFNF